MAGRTWLEHAWLEPTLLLAASRRAAQLSDEARARMKPWVLAARARFQVARELRDAETQTVALGLLREAAFFALSALEAAHSAADLAARSPRAAWQRFDTLVEPSALSGAPEQLQLVRAAFGTDDALSVERLRPREANELRLAAEASVSWLLGLVEIRTAAQLARARWLRSGLALLSLVLIGWGLVAYWLSLAALAPS